MSIPYRDTWRKVRCEAIVRRWEDNPEEPEIVPGPCGRLAKTVVRVGSRDVPSCHVHARKLGRGEM